MKNQTPLTEKERQTIEALPKMNLSGIALTIRMNWPKVYFGAVPYLDAMGSLENITDNYFCDSGKSVVLYFLSNSQTWKGNIARAVKAELNKRCKSC